MTRVEQRQEVVDASCLFATCHVGSCQALIRRGQSPLTRTGDRCAPKHVEPWRGCCDFASDRSEAKSYLAKVDVGSPRSFPCPRLSVSVRLSVVPPEAAGSAQGCAKLAEGV